MILFWLFYIFVFICAASFWYCQSYFGVVVWCRIWLYFQHSGDASIIHLQGKVTSPKAFSNVCHFCLLFLIVSWTITKDLAVQSSDQHFCVVFGVWDTSYSRQVWRFCIQIGHDFFLPQSVFPVHHSHSSYSSTLHKLHRWNSVAKQWKI
jgi:hypothetical protein